ncbi:MAG TPA: hypothetical protein VIY56_09210, partial [Vicinamibacterales bacterium]
MFLFALCPDLAVAQGLEPQSVSGEVQPRRQARAMRILDGTIRLDGHLNESVWESASAIGDLVQKEPVEGAAPGFAT